jgi:hypothetical protein
VSEPNQQGSEQMPRSYTKHSAFNVFVIFTKSEDLRPRVGDWKPSTSSRKSGWQRAEKDSLCQGNDGNLGEMV